MSFRSLALTGAVVGSLSVAGCGSGPAHHAEAPGRQAKVCVAGYRSLGSRRIAYAGAVRTFAAARRRPNGAVIARFGRLNYDRLPMIFAVRGAVYDRNCAPTWYRVQLPIKPNGIVGWVSAASLEVGLIHTRIDVDESAHRLVLYRDGRPILISRVGVGSPATPTPTGSYYVNQRLIPTDPNGPFGPDAVGISAFSNVLTGWTRGGPIGIHGTNEPASIGRNVSNGCIRMPNPVMRRLFRLTLAGTPVVIHA